MQRRHLAQLDDAFALTPAQELAGRARVCGARVRVADIDGKEL
jgi:hypothetical protein